MKRDKKKKDKELILAKHLDGLKKRDLCVLKNHASAPVKEKRLSIELSKKGGQPK